MLKKGFGALTLAAVLFDFGSCEQKTEMEVGFKTTMKVNAVYNAGKIAVGEEIRAKFVVENTGDSPLVFSDVKGSCSCTVASFPKDPIAPGETGVIKATVDTEHAPIGQLQKRVTIMANTTPEATVVSIQAKIIK